MTSPPAPAISILLSPTAAKFHKPVSPIQRHEVFAVDFSFPRSKLKPMAARPSCTRNCGPSTSSRAGGRRCQQHISKSACIMLLLNRLVPCKYVYYCYYRVDCVPDSELSFLDPPMSPIPPRLPSAVARYFHVPRSDPFCCSDGPRELQVIHQGLPHHHPGVQVQGFTRSCQVPGFLIYLHDTTYKPPDVVSAHVVKLPIQKAQSPPIVPYQIAQRKKQEADAGERENSPKGGYTDATQRTRQQG